MVLNPRDYPAARVLRETEPYHFERARQHSNYPRPPQPNTSQPNQKFTTGWGMTTQEYWNSILKDYKKR